MEELYSTITDFENYAISNFGNVLNKKTQRILKPSTSRNGYFHIVLSKNNIQTTYNIHILMANAFIKNPQNKKFVSHINQNKLDNDINNLRFATRIEQSRTRLKKTNCTSIYKGVCFLKTSDRWKSQICINKKVKHLGLFNTELEAAQKYNECIIDNNLSQFFILNIIK